MPGSSVVLERLQKAAILISGTAFLAYGILCVSGSMVHEFDRFQIPRLRIPTGCLEILGGAGMLVGLVWLPALRVSAGGLCLLMLAGFGFRLRFRDSFGDSVASFGFMLLNFAIFVRSFRD